MTTAVSEMGTAWERGEAGHRMSLQTPRQRGRDCRGWSGLGQLNPTIVNEGMHPAII